MPDFAFANADFNRQASALDTLIELVNASSQLEELLSANSLLIAFPSVPPSAKNTMAAAAIVLLAAHFEEYVRQQIEEFAKAIVIEYIHLEEAFKEKFIDSYWRAGSSKLQRIRPKGSLTWAVEAEPLLRSLVQYPVAGNLGDFQAKYICEHENNMRWATVVDLSGRIGVKSLSDLMYKSTDLKVSLGDPRKSEFARTLERKMNEFYELRNSIIHSIAQNAGVGGTVFRAWSEFFRVFTNSFADALTSAFKQFERDVDNSKRSKRRMG